METQPTSVPETATQVGDIRKKWKWVEPSVWTDRMLTALENGVKGNKWFSLIDKVWSVKNLEASFEKVKGNKGAPGIDRLTIEQFEIHRETRLNRLSEILKTEKYAVGKI